MPGLTSKINDGNLSPMPQAVMICTFSTILPLWFYSHWFGRTDRNNDSDCPGSLQNFLEQYLYDFFFLLSFVFCFETSFTVEPSLKLTMQTKLASNSQQFTSLCFQNDEVQQHHTRHGREFSAHDGHMTSSSEFRVANKLSL